MGNELLWSLEGWIDRQQGGRFVTELITFEQAMAAAVDYMSYLAQGYAGMSGRVRFYRQTGQYQKPIPGVSIGGYVLTSLIDAIGPISAEPSDYITLHHVNGNRMTVPLSQEYIGTLYVSEDPAVVLRRKYSFVQF